MDPAQAARTFLALHRIAVVGVSRNPQDFSRAVLRALAARGQDVVPVNAAAGAEELEGRRAFARLSEVSPPVQGALLLVPPAQADDVAAEAIAAGVRHLWFHRGGGAGAASPAALSRCAAAGVEVVAGLCPFMVLSGVGWPHRLHGWLRRRALARAAPPPPEMVRRMPTSARRRRRADAP
jgi:predicted CoA-binding protein